MSRVVSTNPNPNSNSNPSPNSNDNNDRPDKKEDSQASIDAALEPVIISMGIQTMSLVSTMVPNELG